MQESAGGGMDTEKRPLGQQGLYIHPECTASVETGNAADGVYHMPNSLHAESK